MLNSFVGASRGDSEVSYSDGFDGEGCDATRRKPKHESVVSAYTPKQEGNW